MNMPSKVSDMVVFFVVANNVVVIIDIKAILCSIRKLQKWK